GAVPGREAGDVPALPRPPHPRPACGRPRALRRLRALRGRLPGGRDLRQGRGERPGEPGLARRALRRALRDQHAALHLLRHVRGGLPRGRDLAREGLRALGLPARRVHLHEGRAGRAHGEGGLPAQTLSATAGARPGPAANPVEARLPPRFLPRAMTEAPRLSRDADARPVRDRHALLINPFYPKDPHASFGKHVLTPSLALTSIAAATPPDWTVRYWDENLLQGPPPWKPFPQVVGITVHLTFAGRAFALARWYRDRGAKVVFGALH